MPDTANIPVPFDQYTETVRPEWIDHNGHMNMAYYVLAFDEASGALMRYIGIDQSYRDRTGHGTFTGDFHIHYVQEVMESDPLRFHQWIVEFDEKRVHYWLEMYHAKEGYLAAEAEAITLHIDLSARKVAPFPPEVQVRLQSVYRQHKNLRLPKNLGRQIKVKRR